MTELTALVRSGFPIILIETHEEPRILGLLEKLSNLKNQPLFTWSIANGIQRLRKTEKIPQSNEFLDALKHIARIHLAKRCFDPGDFDMAALAAHSDGFSGAEIEQAIVSASFESRAREAPLGQANIESEMRRTRPLSVVMAEKIDALQEWAKERAVFADRGDTEPNPTST